MGRRDGSKNFCSFRRGRAVASRLIFQKQNYVFLGRLFRGAAQFFIHGRAIWRLILEAPEIEETHAVGVEGLRQFDAALEDFVLLLERKVGVKLAALRTEL